MHQQVPCTRKKMISLGSWLIVCCKLAPTLARQIWRHNYIIGRNEYLISALSESAFPSVYLLQFLFKSTNYSRRYERKCERVFFFWTQCRMWLSLSFFRESFSPRSRPICSVYVVCKSRKVPSWSTVHRCSLIWQARHRITLHWMWSCRPVEWSLTHRSLSSLHSVSVCRCHADNIIIVYLLILHICSFSSLSFHDQWSPDKLTVIAATYDVILINLNTLQWISCW